MRKSIIGLLSLGLLIGAESFGVWGGSVVTNNQWNSVVGIRGNKMRNCSAVVIHPQLLMTASHCFENWDREGFINLEISTHDQSKTVQVRIGKSKYKTHPSLPQKFLEMNSNDKKKYLKYDIGFIKLPESIDRFLPGVRPVDRFMNNQMQDMNLVALQKTLTAVGLGYASKGSKTMQKKYLSLLSSGMTSHGALSAAPKDSKSSLCEGDSGGGLFASDRNSEVLVGILSAVAMPCGEGLNAYYSPIKDHVCWAQKSSGIALVADPRTCP